VDDSSDDAHTGPTEPALTFPDLPRLELDQLLRQLVDRAGEVMAAQGRLRGLLRANQSIVVDLALPGVLRRIVEAARDLLDARYAALGVLAADGVGLAEFVHTGMDDVTVERIGDLPVGRGLLGAVIDEGKPIRLRHITGDPRSSGFPPGHPEMESFLGVPIRIREEVFGNLYLAESAHGEFTAEDEELLTALAATAAVAIDNARLFHATTVRGEWMAATAAVTRQMLGASGERPLRLIVERSRQLADADLAILVRPDDSEPGMLRVDIADARPGLEDAVQRVRSMRFPLEGSVSGAVLTSSSALRLTSPDEGPGATPVLGRGLLAAGPMLVVPLVGMSTTDGVLTVVRLEGEPAFREADLELVAGFANQAAVALELAEARAERERLRVAEERERIAADLHDHVIQRLFGAGLSLQSVAGRVEDPEQAERLRGVVGDLDETIAQIRTTIFALQQPEHAGGVRAMILQVVDEATEVLGFGPALRFTGPADTLASDEDLADDMTAVLREALANVAKHAAAKHCDVDVVVDAATATVEIVVADDGRGPGVGGRRSGLANLRRRAERRGGSFALAPGESGGSRLSWSVPLP